jgi:hypothetical protein
MDPQFFGLARVDRLASSYPGCFRQYKAYHCESVADVPVGQIVLCLPLLGSDVGWRAVVVNIIIDEIERARIAWIHPDCLRPLESLGARPCARVDLTDKRGSKTATINIGPEEVGTRIVGGALVLDARWIFELPRQTRDCNGHCFMLCRSVLTHEVCLASILRFAASLHVERTSYCATHIGHICCHHGKHRSVASANVLRLCFGVPVDLSRGSSERCMECCGMRAEDHVPGLIGALRTLPKLVLTPEKSLACVLQLPKD